MGNRCEEKQPPTTPEFEQVEIKPRYEKTSSRQRPNNAKSPKPNKNFHRTVSSATPEHKLKLLMSHNLPPTPKSPRPRFSVSRSVLFGGQILRRARAILSVSPVRSIYESRAANGFPDSLNEISPSEGAAAFGTVTN